METLIGKLELLRTWKQTMRKTCRRNKLNIEIVSYFTPIRFRASMPNFVALHKRKSQEKCQRWLQNQLKAFYWVCLAVSCVEDRKIAEFEEPQWNMLYEIFFFKNKMTVTYEAKRLVHGSKSQKSWSKEEENLFAQLMKNQDVETNRWNEKARQLYEHSNGEFLRSGKQIRQKWLNHLDPSKNHGEWTQQQERQMIQVILRDGRRWSKIAKTIQTNRTEHMVKNRYKTIIGRLRKKYAGIKDEDVLLKKYLEKGSPTVQSAQIERDETGFQGSIMKREHSNPINIRQIQEYLQEDQKDDEQEDQESPQQRKDKINISGFRSSSGIDLAQVYSPWVMGIPSTPAFSPSIGYFLNISNFSSVDNAYSGSFYNPDKPQ